MDGGEAMRLTVHPAADSRPFFSPDGLEIAFMSERSGTTQMHVVPTTGGKPRQVTRDTHRKYLLGYAADGAHLIIAGTTDRGWTRMESTRLFLIDPEGKEAKRMLFDAGFAEAALAPAAWNRKGYQGPSDPSIEIDSQYDSDCTTCAPGAEKRLPRELG